MIAKSEGQATVTTDSADWIPYHDVLLFARDDAVPAAQIDFGSAIIDVLPAVVATSDSAVTNEDEVVNVPVLANDVGRDLAVSAFDAESQLGAKLIHNGDGKRASDDVFLDRRFVAEDSPARNAGVATKEIAADCMLPSDAWPGYDDPVACLGGNGSRP